MSKYKNLSQAIINNVGGSKNIITVTHCATRLRFNLKDETKAQTEQMNNLTDVLSVIQSGGQYQVVIGNHVQDVYDTLTTSLNIEQAKETVSHTEEKSNLFAKLLSIINAIFSPILSLLAASGMMKGFSSLLIVTGALTENSGTFLILNAIGDTLFYFFPIFLGKNAMKRFGGNETLGMILGAVMLYPSLVATMDRDVLYTLFVGTIFESPIYLEFLGIPIIMMNYGSSVIPIILVAAIAAPIEKSLKKHLHPAVNNMLTPFLTLLLVVPLALGIIGVIASYLSMFLGQLALSIYQLNPIIAGLLLGGFWQILVMFGLHWGIIPLYFLNLSVLGYDPILALTYSTSFAQIGTVLALVLKTKNITLKTNGLSAFFTGIFGITEPAIYGITLPRKKAFIYSCIGGSIGGAIIGGMGTVAYVAGGLGIFELPSFINTSGIDLGFYGAIIGILVAFTVGFMLTFFGMKQKEIDHVYV